MNPHWVLLPPPLSRWSVLPSLCHPEVSAQQWLRFWTEREERDIQLCYLGNRVCLQPFHLSSHSVIILSWTNCFTQAPFWLYCCPPTSIPPTGERSMGTFSVAWHFQSRGTVNRIKKGGFWGRFLRNWTTLWQWKLSISFWLYACKLSFMLVKQKLQAWPCTPAEITVWYLEQSATSAATDLFDVKWELQSTIRPLW